MSETNYCPGCNHPVLLRAPDGTCGERECSEFVAARDRGENVEAPFLLRRRALVASPAAPSLPAGEGGQRDDRFCEEHDLDRDACPFCNPYPEVPGGASDGDWLQ